MKVKLEIFEGPLDLLLYLIKKNEVDIYNIPVAEITAQYLGYLDLLKLMDLNVVGDYLVLASTLMHIKSKMLLPVQEKEEDEEEDPRQDLVSRLLEYRKFKEVADRLKNMETVQLDTYTRKAKYEDSESIPVHFEANIFNLIDVFRNVMKDVPKDMFEKVINDEITVEEKTRELKSLLESRSKLYFTKLLKASKSKIEIIATLLSILELIRLQEVMVWQEKPFGEIEIIKACQTGLTAG